MPKPNAVVRALAVLCVANLFLATAQAEKPKGEGWTPIFDGKTLAGWKLPSEGAEVWSVIDGTIDCNPKTGGKVDKSLWTEKSFGDFQLYMEWRIKETHGLYDMPIVLPDGTDKKNEKGETILEPRPNADSGIYLRGNPKAQVNIWCWPVGSGEVYGYRTDAKQSAEVRKGVTPIKNADKPVGEWNTFLITMKGDRLTVELNGETVIKDAQLPEVPASGPLALQHHGGFDAAKNEWNSASSLVQFRDIYIKE